MPLRIRQTIVASYVRGEQDGHVRQDVRARVDQGWILGLDRLLVYGDPGYQLAEIRYGSRANLVYRRMVWVGPTGSSSVCW